MADEMDISFDLPRLVDGLGVSRRRVRQDAAHQIALLAHQDAQALKPYVEELLDALYRPEAQTRWEIFDALSELALTDANMAVDGYDSAEASLFDETSATVRLAAFRFLCRVGASSPERSDMVWPVLDESVQCYHGNPEYHDMLVALLEFSRGDLSPMAREALVARVAFDAENGRNYIKAYSTQIIAAAKGGN